MEAALLDTLIWTEFALLVMLHVMNAQEQHQRIAHHVKIRLCKRKVN
jgi:hypothetical protein